MFNIYLIIVLIVVTLVNLVLSIRNRRFNNSISNKKLETKDFTSDDFIPVQPLIKNNSLSKILIVEDDPANRKILKAQLTAAKYKVVTAVDGFSALSTINKDPEISLVLLDLILPDISGFKVCEKIRESFTMYEKPVIMVTSKNYIKDLIDGFEAGANDFVTKPYNIYELITRINSSISLKRIFEDNTSLKKINQLKSDIVDMAAHDLKSPLTLISGYSNRILKSSDEDSIERKNASKIVDSSNKMLNIINKLLDDSKSENQVLNFEIINIKSIITESIEFYNDMAFNKAQTLTFICEKDSYDSNIDRNSFTTIIDNLISNAIKYSPENSEIIIKLYDEGDLNCITIKDFGNGFTNKEIDNLFKKYFPYKNKPTKGETSTGLGLYIVNDMVAKNYGTIALDSSIGEGSEFKLNFLKS